MAKTKKKAEQISVALTHRQLLELVMEMRPGGALRFLRENPDAAKLLGANELRGIALRAGRHTQQRINQRLAELGVGETW